MAAAPITTPQIAGFKLVEIFMRLPFCREEAEPPDIAVAVAVPRRTRLLPDGAPRTSPDKTHAVSRYKIMRGRPILLNGNVVRLLIFASRSSEYLKISRPQAIDSIFGSIFYFYRHVAGRLDRERPTSALDSLPTRLPFWISRHYRTIGEPGWLMRSPDMHGRCCAWVVVKRRHPENDMRLGRSLGDELCSTNGAEAAQFTG